MRRLGHDVLTSFESGKANAAVPDAEVLAFCRGRGPDSLVSQTAVIFSICIEIGLRTTPEISFARSIQISADSRSESTRSLL